MSIEFNHTLVHAKDTWAAAREVGGVLGLAEPSSYGPFAVLQFDNGATLDFIEDTGEIKAQHYAFLVGEDDFDAIWGRLKEQGRQWWADPHKRQPGRDQPRGRRPRPLLAGPGRPLAGDHHPPVRQRGLIYEPCTGATAGSLRGTSARPTTVQQADDLAVLQVAGRSVSGRVKMNLQTKQYVFVQPERCLMPPVHPYLDPALSPEQRAEDLLSRMSLEDKAGQLFHSQIGMGPDGTLADADPAFGLPSTEDFVLSRRMTHFNLLGVVEDPRLVAQWHNRLQELAASTPLGIPITVSTDPRHHFTDNPGTAFNAGAVSQWPEPLGLAALRSAELVQRFAEIARQEYLALGFRLALHPQVDLATEPRWSRIAATFGEDADLTTELAVAYVRGFQGPEVGPTSVSTMTKHFPGGGPQLDGEDPHFAYGREQVYPGDNLEYHLKPFAAVIRAGGSQIMPYYGMPIGTELEPVAFGFNRGVMTGLLRERFGFDGIVCTDWGLINDAEMLGQPMPARAWGVEHLSPLERVEMVLDAGCDQFGGESCPELVVELVRAGRVRGPH